PAKAGTDDGDARIGRRRGWMKFVVHGALRWLRHAVDPQWFAASSDRGRWKRWPTQRECMGGVSAVVRSCNCYRPDSRFSRWLRLHYRTTRGGARAGQALLAIRAMCPFAEPREYGLRKVAQGQ